MLEPAFISTGNRLKNKYAVVTGGGSGIGAAIAARFVAEGAFVHIWDLNQKAAQNLADRLNRTGGTSQVQACDVSNVESVREAARLLPQVDILVNCAGIPHVGTVETTKPADFDRLFAVNVKGVYHCMREVVPQMKSRRNGVILNLASIVSKIGIADRFAYSMTKGAVLTMTLSVARDYVSYGVRCNCICPARIHTPFVETLLKTDYPNNSEEMFAKLSSFQPIGRMGQPAEVAALAAFLCSDEAAFITGSTYDIDGGVTLLR